MKVVLACPTIVENDAVGHDIIEQYYCLKNEGIEAYLYADNYDKNTAKLVSRKSLELLEHRDSLLIYHHAIYWEKGKAFLKKSSCKKIVKYHNITPESYFKPYSVDMYNLCLHGRRQNQKIVDFGIDMLIADSSFNANDFLHLGFPEDKIRVLAPFNKVHAFDKCQADTAVLRRLKDSKINVFFISRIAPNKGHKHILLTASRYKQLFGNNIRFIIAGGLDQKLQIYHQELLELVNQLDIADIVEFVGHISSAALKAYYLGSHSFLLLSEHEGFCVPILEAQYFKTPIIGYASSAVQETIGNNQLVYDELNYELFASAIHTLYNNIDTRNALAQEGYRNFLKYEKECLKARFLSYIRELG